MTVTLQRNFTPQNQPEIESEIKETHIDENKTPEVCRSALRNFGWSAFVGSTIGTETKHEMPFNAKKLQEKFIKKTRQKRH